jgi:hypothetical protein
MVYVDTAKNKYGRMIMSHMIADTEQELHDMAQVIGVKRKWFQNKASFPHYDICQNSKLKALENGAIELQRRPFVYKMRDIKAYLVYDNNQPKW